MDERVKSIIDLLKKKQSEFPLLEKELDKDKVYQWRNEVLIILDKLFGDQSKYYKQFDELSFDAGGFIAGGYEQAREEGCLRDLKNAGALINAIIFGVENALFV